MNPLRKVLWALFTGLILVLALMSPSLAQTWPQRLVRFIVPLGPGSGVDITARLLADKLTARWGQPVVVDNRPGGDGIIAITAFVNARDDHTLLFTPTSAFTAHPFQQEKLPYNVQDLVPIARVSITLVALAVSASLKVSSVGDLIGMVRARPGQFNFATAVGMTDFIYEGYFKSAGLVATRVPYRDTLQALNDLGEGRIQAYVGGLPIVQPHVQSGRVKLIAMTNVERAPTLPELPTVTQAGYPALAFDGLAGLFGPRTMAADIRERIAADIRAVAADPVLAARLITTGQVLRLGSPAEFSASIEEQRAKLAAIVKEIGVKPAQ